MLRIRLKKKYIYIYTVTLSDLQKHALWVNNEVE